MRWGVVKVKTDKHLPSSRRSLRRTEWMSSSPSVGRGSSSVGFCLASGGTTFALNIDMLGGGDIWGDGEQGGHGLSPFYVIYDQAHREMTWGTTSISIYGISHLVTRSSTSATE